MNEFFYIPCVVWLCLTMFNSCHIYNKYHRPDVDVEGLFEIYLRQAIPCAIPLEYGEFAVGRSLPT